MSRPARVAHGVPAPGPLGLVEARHLLRPLADVEHLLIAVSGGPDSVALMHFAAASAASAALAGESFPRLTVATVDHGLRHEARAEAEAVAVAARHLGLGAVILTWDGEKPVTRIQEEARRHRYILLADGARALGASHLATAHTLDDQAETLLFRMARGSGPAGLVGMRPCVERHGIRHVRPFLGVAKARLVAACLDGGWAHVQDPSNSEPRYARTRFRRLMPALAAEGLDAERFAVLARRLAEVDAVVAMAARRALDEARLLPEVDPATFRAARLMAEPPAVLCRMLDCLLVDGPHAGRPPPRGPRLNRVEALGLQLRAAWAEVRPLRRTLHGSIVSFDGRGLLTIAAEKPRRQPLPKAASDRVALPRRSHPVENTG